MLSIFNTVLTNQFSVGIYLACLLCAGLCGAVAALALSRDSASSRSFLLSLVVLPIIVTTVIVMVNGSVGTGIAVAGAFSLVRFRSAAGRAKDISAIFLVMTAGLACAAGPMSCDRFLDLRITVPESLHFADAFDDLFREYTKEWKLMRAKTANMGSLYKLDYQVEMKDPGRMQEFLDALRCRNGNLEIALLCAAEGGDEL